MRYAVPALPRVRSTRTSFRNEVEPAIFSGKTIVFTALPVFRSTATSFAEPGATSASPTRPESRIQSRSFGSTITDCTESSRSFDGSPLSCWNPSGNGTGLPSFSSATLYGLVSSIAREKARNTRPSGEVATPTGTPSHEKATSLNESAARPSGFFSGALFAAGFGGRLRRRGLRSRSGFRRRRGWGRAGGRGRGGLSERHGGRAGRERDPGTKREGHGIPRGETLAGRQAAPPLAPPWSGRGRRQASARAIPERTPEWPGRRPPWYAGRPPEVGPPRASARDLRARRRHAACSGWAGLLGRTPCPECC